MISPAHRDMVRVHPEPELEFTFTGLPAIWRKAQIFGGYWGSGIAVKPLS